MEFSHLPVMLEECMTALNLKSDGIYFDGTLGGTGHSYQILKRSNGASLIATDLDLTALAVAKERLKEFEGKTTLIHDNFKNFKSIVEELGIDQIDGALLDLGVSSYQLDERSRGFSYMSRDVRLDMRMNTDANLSAYEVVNEYSEKRLKEILYLYGEERFSANIARNIVAERAKKPITTTGELVDIIEKSIPAKFKKDGHPAKRTFQAIRIEVNRELDSIRPLIEDAANALAPTGRIAIISFHSLEDRIVKQTYKSLMTGCTCPKDFPVCICGNKPKIKEVTKKPTLPSNEELNANPRARSAKLRVAEKI